MKLSKVLETIVPPKGFTTIVNSILAGDLACVQPQDAIGKTLAEAKKELEKATKNQINASSDWAYWGFAGDVAYWTCIVDLLKAATITGPDNLPDVSLPGNGMTVMDALHELTEFGKQVLKEAKLKINEK